MHQDKHHIALNKKKGAVKEKHFYNVFDHNPILCEFFSIKF